MASTIAKYVTALALTMVTSVVLFGAAEADCLTELSGATMCGTGPCATDLHGRVSCAQWRFGSVMRTIHGKLVCGKGQCVVALNGHVLCSTAEGGGATTQLDGKVVCDGGCEPASADYCERTPAQR
jgi:hypothetical protein